MEFRKSIGVLLSLLLAPSWAVAETDPPFHVPYWTAAPFVCLLLGIAVLPLFAGHFWESNRRKGVVVLVFSLPVVGYLLYRNADTAGQSLAALWHVGGEYVSFIVLLASLYAVSGGILLTGDIQAKPLTNVGFLALGGLIANLIGTTGASMLLIRPVLQINKERKNTSHLAVFFIFIVSNLGGVLTPLGDPPLFLGFLNGVDFFWTMTLWRQWLLVNAVVLTIFFIWDTIAYRREKTEDIVRDIKEIEPMRLQGLINLLFLAGIIAAVLLQSPKVGLALADFVPFGAATFLPLGKWQGAGLMAVMAALSMLFTPARLRNQHGFEWDAMVEVAVIFAGIFVTMVPALALLRQIGPGMGLERPWQYFWLTGGLSSFLDNAPTYLAFATVAAGPNDLHWLMLERPDQLAAISCGAVFMGANSYLGNAPNFMVKAIADAAGYRTPSFFGYMFYSGLVLLPVFGLMTVLFFR